MAARKRTLIILALLSASLAAILAWAHWPLAPLPEGVRADKVVVYKAERRLVLMAGGRELTSYPVALGPNPSGHKEREGDGRTPEGLYVIDYRNPNSSFYLSLHVSYPESRDRQAADRGGWDPGGLIMVHGLPNRAPFLGRLHRLVDWTNGCIAVTNQEMRQIWEAVPDGTPIEILGDDGHGDPSSGGPPSQAS